MARVIILTPKQFLFKTVVPVRITDINYGNHLGNDKVLSIIHEARVQFLAHLGGSELDIMGSGLIMADAAIQYRSECFYGTKIEILVAVNEISTSTFDMIFLLRDSENSKEIARAKTGMVCFNYAEKKVIKIPEMLKSVIGLSNHTIEK
ncbi:thioesterase family protein [bacterium]|nr:thioesterase family protein [bacterium]